jgi:hypothetical protein
LRGREERKKQKRVKKGRHKEKRRTENSINETYDYRTVPA